LTAHTIPAKKSGSEVTVEKIEAGTREQANTEIERNEKAEKITAMNASQDNPTAANTAPSPDSPLRSVHTSNFPQILKECGISLIVSTYQAGKLIVVRADGDVINTHFRLYQKPMGIAASRDKIAVGTGNQIWELYNIPAVTKKLEPPDRHDACYLPRNIHIIGDIDQ
jgi:hypothetical protein